MLRNPKQNKHPPPLKNIYIWTPNIQALKTKDKANISKATTRGKKDPFQKEQRITADFSAEVMWASRQQHGTSEVLKGGRGEAQEDAQSHSEQMRGVLETEVHIR